MKYNDIYKAVFLERPNRFIAKCELYGETHTVHVKNTGRCRELLVYGATVYLEKSSNLTRKTAYDLVSVEKGNLLINMDSQAPNHIAKEGIESGIIPINCNYDRIKSEVTQGNSRFDLGFYKDDILIGLVEIKGVTLEEDTKVMFPDAPTQRGIRHIKELIELHNSGLYTGVLFIVQLEGATSFSPNIKTSPEFGEILTKAKNAGVELISYGCSVSPYEVKASYIVDIKI